MRNKRQRQCLLRTIERMIDGLVGRDGFRLLNDIMAYALVEKRIILTVACLIVTCEIELRDLDT